MFCFKYVSANTLRKGDNKGKNNLPFSKVVLCVTLVRALVRPCLGKSSCDVDLMPKEVFQYLSPLTRSLT